MASSALRTLETYVQIETSPDKFHDMFCNRPHHVHLTNYERVQGCDLHEGDWGTVGSIICWKYVHDGKAKTAKQVIDAIDFEKNSITFKMLEGDLMEECKSFKATIQASPKNDGEGSIVHWFLEYEKQHEGIADPVTLVQFFIDLTKDVDAYLLKEN